MNVSLSALQVLNKFRKKTIHQLTVEDVAEALQVLEINADPSSMHKVLDIFANDDDEQLVEWILEPANQGKVLEIVKPAERKLTIACPACSELALYRVSEVANVNPHVLCRFCSSVIKLEAE